MDRRAVKAVHAANELGDFSERTDAIEREMHSELRRVRVTSLMAELSVGAL
eukprot:SAG11_NODE_75_length_18024_cov_5.885356_15_plen_51_part_00